ncbi:hypothetical protein [Planctomycetes bacterium K23_9]|uniref:GTPase-associated protein 1 N-terminal domain-containing protein n=1 Tax=Stieleria marina TaxID=1930275 RepID=A0A517NM10_9BACT|nr:hypothetical protein K239x_01020 [Planctomycetes bacterium K23_9]
MNTINVQQAIFASSDRGSMKGYQLVAKSDGIDRWTSQELCRWMPSRAASDDPNDWSINYFPIKEDCFAITRSVLGGPEYSGRGATQLVTLILLLSDSQFALYSYDPISVANTAMAMGLLRLPLEMRCSELPMASLPDAPLLAPTQKAGEPTCQREQHMLDELTSLIDQSRRVAVVGRVDPIKAVSCLMPRLSSRARREFSFTTGLPPAVRRPFQAHFLTSVDKTNRRNLETQQIVPVAVR